MNNQAHQFHGFESVLFWLLENVFVCLCSNKSLREKENYMFVIFYNYPRNR